MFLTLKTLVIIEALLVLSFLMFRAGLRRDFARVVAPWSLLGINLAIPAVALLSNNFFVFLGALVVLVAASGRSRREIAWSYIAILPMMPSLAQELGAGGVYIFPLSAIAAVNLGALIGSVIRRGRAAHRFAAIDAAVLLFSLALVYIYDRDFSATSFVRAVAIYGLATFVPYWVVARGLSTRFDATIFALRLSLAGFMGAVVGIFQASRHWLLYQRFYEALHVEIPFGSMTMAMRAGFMRTGGPILDYTAGGLFMAVSLVAMLALRKAYRPAWFAAFVAIGALGLFVSQSRGAWTAAIAGYLFLLVARRDYGKAALIGGLGGGGLLMVLSLATGRLAQLLGKTDMAADTIDYRQNLFTAGMQQFYAHPIAGQDPKVLASNMPEMVQGQHIVDFVNSHLFVAMTGGAPTFAIWCLMWLIPIAIVLKRRTVDREMDVASLAGAIVFATVIALAATSLIDRNLNWALVSLGMLAAALKRQGAPAVAKRALRFPQIARMPAAAAVRRPEHPGRPANPIGA